MRVTGLLFTLLLAVVGLAMNVTPGLQDMGLAPYFWGVAAVLLLLTTVSWPIERFWKRKHMPENAPDPGIRIDKLEAKDEAVVSVGQTGGQTAHTIHNYGPLPRIPDEVKFSLPHVDVERIRKLSFEVSYLGDVTDGADTKKRLANVLRFLGVAAVHDGSGPVHLTMVGGPGIPPGILVWTDPKIPEESTDAVMRLLTMLRVQPHRGGLASHGEDVRLLVTERP